jgi:hypothetical protein
MYRAQNQAWLDEVSESIVKVTKGFEKPDRKYAYAYLHNYVKLDDLHKAAIRKFPGKTIEFGFGSMKPIVAVVTKDPITKDQKEKLKLAWKKLGIPEDEVYYAHLRFVKTKKKQEARQEILNKLIGILKPQMLIAFDGVKVDYEGDAYQTDDPISIVTSPEATEERKQMMRALKNFSDSSD